MRALLPLLLCISLAALPAYATSSDEPSERAPDVGVLFDAGAAGGAALFGPVIGLATFAGAQATGLLDLLLQASSDAYGGFFLGALVLPSVPLAFAGALTSAWLRGLPLQDAAMRGAFGGDGALIGAATGAVLGAIVGLVLPCEDRGLGAFCDLGQMITGFIIGSAIGGGVGGATGVLAHATIFGEPADVE